MNLYEDCPKKWHFKYVEKIPERPKHFFSFGKSMHTALEFLYGVKVLPPPSLEEVVKHYHEKWISEGYQSAEQEADYKAQGIKILEDYYQKNVEKQVESEDFKLPYFVEYGWRLEIEGVPLVGYVDRVDKDKDDESLSIIDYKTGKAIPMSRVKSDGQLTLYQMACEKLLGLKVKELTFYHLPSQTALTVPRHGPKLEDAVREKVVRVAGKIKSGDYTPKPEERKCDWCDYKRLCPVWKHLYATQERPDRPPVAKTDDKLAKLVDRYGKMKEDIKEREAKADELKKAIVATLEDKKYVRAFGAHFEAAVHTEERWEFKDKKKVLDAIQRAGFWERIIAPSAPAVQKLMKDPNLPLDLRERLQRLGTKVSNQILRLKKIEEEE